ncbi:MAG: GNVR domain-containing protein [Bacteroidota bacterium]
MNLQKEFRTLILPVIKGMPVIIMMCIVAAMVAKRYTNYMTPKYRTYGSMKIQKRDYGIMDFMLFDQPPPKSAADEFLTELEMLKSKTLHKKVFKQLDFDINYYRVGKMRTAELYKKSPFKVNYEIKDKKGYDKTFTLTYVDKDTIEVIDYKGRKDTLLFEETMETDYVDISISKNDSLLAVKPQALRSGDIFNFKINSQKAQLGIVNAKDFFLKTLHKDVYIVKIYYAHEVPDKAMLFVNELMKTYLRNDRESKDFMAYQTLDFVDAQLEDVSVKLKKAERDLMGFLKKNEIVDTELQMDANLKQVTQLDLQRVAMEIEMVELENLDNLMNSEVDMTNFSPNFNTIKDKIFQNAFGQLQALVTQEKDLLTKYSETSSEVSNIRAKIASMRSFILESIDKRKDNLEKTKKEVEDQIGMIQGRLNQTPDLNQEIMNFEREVKLYENLYNYLLEKKAELSIAQSANMTFHEVLEWADMPTNTIAPNTTIIVGFSVFLAMLFGILGSYLIAFLTRKVTSKKVLEATSEFPIIGIVPAMDEKVQDLSGMLNLYSNLNASNLLQEEGEGAKVIVVSGKTQEEGKSFIANRLARVFAHFNRRVLLMDLDLIDPEQNRLCNQMPGDGIAETLLGYLEPEAVIQENVFPRMDLMGAGSVNGHAESLIFSKDVLLTIEKMRSKYDLIVVDTPAFQTSLSAIPVMQMSDVNLFILRSKYSRMADVKRITKLVTEYKIDQVQFVLNRVNMSEGIRSWLNLSQYLPWMKNN